VTVSGLKEDIAFSFIFLILTDFLGQNIGMNNTAFLLLIWLPSGCLSVFKWRH